MEDSAHETSVFLGLRALRGIELFFSGLTRRVVVRQDLLQDATDLSEIFSC